MQTLFNFIPFRAIVLEAIQNNPEKTNSEIATHLLESREEFKNAKPDSLRRFVSKTRNAEGKIREEPQPETGFTFKQEGQTATATGITAKRITSLEGLIEFFEVDLKVWRVKKWECTVYESHTRLRHYDQGYQVATGYARVDDEHKVVPLYRVWAQFEENKPLIELADVKSDMLQDLKKASKKYPKIQYPLALKKPRLLEINIFDLHFGKLTWAEEVGCNYDIKIARELFLTCLNQLIEQSKNYSIERVLFPVGNDFFNVDNPANTTTAGTPQDEDGRWKKTFKRGRELMVEGIDMLREIAPVDVLIVPGNHDSIRAFQLGDSLECWYHQCEEVNIDNSAKIRKYYQYGKSLIGYTHGREEKPFELPMIMAAEAPKMWAETKYREWHLGDIHHKKEIKWIATEEFKGTTVRFMRSITSTDAWHFSKGYISSLRAGEGFIWDNESGLICQFSANM